MPEARRFVGEVLAGCPAQETLMMCVTEFSANAVEHTDSGRGGSYMVEVARPRDGLARVAVTDEGGASVPAAGPQDPLADGGRGLAMVAASTSRWGYADAYPGRTVWAESTWPIPVLSGPPPSAQPSAQPAAPAASRPAPPLERPVPPRSRKPKHARPRRRWISPRWPGGPAA